MTKSVKTMVIYFRKAKMPGTWWAVYVEIFGVRVRVPFVWYRIA